MRYGAETYLTDFYFCMFLHIVMADGLIRPANAFENRGSGADCTFFELQKKKKDSQDGLLSQLVLKETEEILKLSSEEDLYNKNMNALKVNDLNFDQMNKQAGKNRYVILGNQV